MVSQQTTGLIVNDAGLAFYMTLLFMVSLVIILVSDKVNMTRSLRQAMLEAHFVLLKMLRGIVTVGLFMVGQRIGSSGGFLGGLQEATPFIETTTTTWFLQKLVEWFTVVNVYSVYSATNFDPAIGDGILQSVMQVLHDYLLTYNTTVLASLTGDLVHLKNPDQVAPFDFQMVSGDRDAGANTVGQVKTLRQAYTTSGNFSYNQSKLSGGFDGSRIWYYSPLLIGVVVGML
jgi:hypothetical protein